MKVARDLVGTLLSDRYRLVSRVAGGGMGEVYRGHDLLLDRSVAVKILQPSLAADDRLVDRFRAEARAAARLAHPNIVAVHDWGCEGTRTYYMVMEYVSGTDLRDLLVSRGALDPVHASSMIASVCDALAAAHAAGLVHRDVKPENILLARDGTVKVADFGIAVMADADRSNPSGTIPGTLRYLSPEQARGEDATPASDIWATGAVLSELVTSVPPTAGGGLDALRKRGTEEVRPPSDHDPRLPEALDEIVLRACALDPARRYGSAAEMGADLRGIARQPNAAPPVESLLDHVTGEIRLPDMEPTTFVSERSKRRSRLARLKLVAAIALLIALFGAGRAVAGWLFAAEVVEIPDLAGKSRAQAAQMTEELGLDLRVAGRDRSFSVRPGAVISQSPSEGEVKEGATIDVVLSSGLPKFRVPDVVGMDYDEALMRLRIHLLKPGRVDERYSPERAGTVISQSPTKGKLEARELVDLVVSKGPQPVEIPDVAGQPYAAAAQLLEDAGLVVVRIDEYSDTVPEGSVISTDPTAGTVRGMGDEVEVVVSKGPQYETFTMPDVRNMSVAQATARLEGMGLSVRVVRSCPGETVVETHPIAGTKVRENQTVALFVC